MKVTNNRFKSATFCYMLQGKMKKVSLKPFESLEIKDLVDINAVRSSMVISNFTVTKPVSLKSTIVNVVDPYGSTHSVDKTFDSLPPERQTKGRFEIKYI